MSQQAIKVENLNKSFGEGDAFVDVIHDASFVIDKGELVALVAPSGTGKTVLLMMLGCVSEPNSGKMYLGDEKVYDDGWLTKETRKIRREKIGFIFQAHYLIPFLNIIDNLTLLPQANGVADKVSSWTTHKSTLKSLSKTSASAIMPRYTPIIIRTIPSNIPTPMAVTTNLPSMCLTSSFAK